jgi:hypothetical protein
MGGSIEVRGREPSGTTMVVRLPLATPVPPEPREQTDELIPARSTP